MFTETTKKQVWAKASTLPDLDSNRYRIDACGAIIEWDKYGDRNHSFGWEIDHICPQATLAALYFPQETIDCIDNLRAMNWANNKSKSDDYPEYYAAKTRKEVNGNYHNIGHTSKYTVNKDTQNKLKSLYGI